ncbi:amino acid permease [Gardnerella greenwoodii 00703Dmash]|uniref:Amino acid permease n=2 Tax=Gardnerella greenwoodii TaxID=2914925 RepID=I4MB89_9BIFI|nr:amino acid permease [Gardnerella greenwoodii 00703Dmash]
MNMTANNGINVDSQQSESADSAGEFASSIKSSNTSSNSSKNSSTNSSSNSENNDNSNQMERSLTKRHVQFIAIGGTIGTGLFLGSGKSISLTGPSIVFVYIIVGLIMFLLMRGIGELMYKDPNQHTFISFITRYLGRGWGNFAGWSYWFVLVLIGMSEITAVSTYCVTFFQTFDIDVSHWKWLIEVVFLAALVCINLVAVKLFGETEFWFSMIKITLIVALIVTAVVMVIIGYHYPATQLHGGVISPAGHASVNNIFNNFSLMPNGWVAFLMSFQMVFYAYQLIEFVGVTVSETKNPRKVLPKAINGIITRILIFYVGALVAIMLIVPWQRFKATNAEGTFMSPFIMVFQYAGVHWASALVFFVVITAASSALNSLLYSAGRHMYQIAIESPSPILGKLRKVSHTKVPARAIIFSSVLILLSPVVNSIPGVHGAFILFASASSAVIIMIYILIMVTHRKYRKSADFMADGFLMPHYKLLNSLTIAFFVFVYITLFISEDTRVSAIGGLVWLVLFGGYCALHEHWQNRDLAAALRK